MTESRKTDPTPGAAERDPGLGRSRPLTGAERERIAKQQGELIASGRARKGHIVLRTPLRRAIFVGGLVGIGLLALIVAIAA